MDEDRHAAGIERNELRRMPQVNKTATRAYWLRIGAGNLLASIVVVFAFSGATLATPPLRLLTEFAVSFVFSCCIAVPLGFTMPRVGPWIWRRVGFPFNWMAAAAFIATVGTLGSVVAISAMGALGLIRPILFRDWFAQSFRITVVMTLTIGLFIMAYEMMRKRLDDATLALRTKERDEAEARRLAVEAQLASIESRVQPHFLFNTLNSIAALVHHDPDGAERMTGQLAALLRSALDSSGTPLVPLEEELKVVRAYLDIEQVRFGDRLRYAVTLGEHTGHAMVPRMAVQTLVENSVKYAVSVRRAGASIMVHAAAADGRLRLMVEDDGPGFDAALRPAGHGLDLLAARLVMLFGDRGSLHVESRPGYTAVTVDVPSHPPSAIANHDQQSANSSLPRAVTHQP
jgi:two-component system, LytTR family, sensor histidine kinase AlgZ